MIPTLEALRAQGIVSPLAFHFARTIGRLGDDHRPEILLALALLCRQVSQGHVCLDLEASDLSLLDTDERGVRLALPDPQSWRVMLAESRLVGGPSAAKNIATPLVLDSKGRLYLARYFLHEEKVKNALLARASATGPKLDRARLEDGLDRLFGRSEPGRENRQKDAARAALDRTFSVVSGGPGTGKTSTVVKILALLVEQSVLLLGDPPRVSLLAPTGKAAARLSQAIASAKQPLAVDDRVRALIPEDASTIHRALGVIPGSATRFRHDAEHPLPAEVVLVDEASMIDLALLARLLDAVSPSARLILLGDKDQLASVEAGAVLGDICAAAEVGAKKPLPPPISSCITTLDRSYRYAPKSGIARLAEAINRGDPGDALLVLAQAEDVALAPPLSLEGSFSLAFESALLAGFSGLFVREAGERLTALDRFRVLCAHRRGPFGVERVNAAIERCLRRRGLLPPAKLGPDPEPLYAGRPIMVSKNDHDQRLYNGDSGVLVENKDRELRALFRAENGLLRWLSPARLPPHETAFALSVHKSQGSELDEVWVILPDEPSPILSRELLYTAVTRARKKVTIAADPRVLAYAIEQRIQRSSGLCDALLEARGTLVGP